MGPQHTVRSQTAEPAQRLFDAVGADPEHGIFLVCSGDREVLAGEVTPSQVALTMLHASLRRIVYAATTGLTTRSIVLAPDLSADREQTIAASLAASVRAAFDETHVALLDFRRRSRRPFAASAVAALVLRGVIVVGVAGACRAYAATAEGRAAALTSFGEFGLSQRGWNDPSMLLRSRILPFERHTLGEVQDSASTFILPKDSARRVILGSDGMCRTLETHGLLAWLLTPGVPLGEAEALAFRRFGETCEPNDASLILLDCGRLGENDAPAANRLQLHSGRPSSFRADDTRPSAPMPRRGAMDPSRKRVLAERLAQALDSLYWLAFLMSGSRRDAYAHLEQFVAGYFANAADRELDDDTALFELFFHQTYVDQRKAEHHKFSILDRLHTSTETEPYAGDDLTDESLGSDSLRHSLCWEMKRTCLAGLLDSMPPKVRVTFILLAVFSYTPAQAAKIQGTSERSVAVLWSRAHRRLDALLPNRCTHMNRHNSCYCEGLLGPARAIGLLSHPGHSDDTPQAKYDAEPASSVGELYRRLPRVKLSDRESVDLMDALV